MKLDEIGFEVEDPQIMLATGRWFHILNPDPAEVFIEDIAASISKLCRYTGHVSHFYSVAQHCVLVSHHVPPEHAMWGLLHDATEAYIGDISRPLKKTLDIIAPGAIKTIEGGIMDAIAERFGLEGDMPQCVKVADNLLLATERRDLMPLGKENHWPGLPDPLSDAVNPWEPEVARGGFLKRFYQLRGEDD